MWWLVAGVVNVVVGVIVDGDGAAESLAVRAWLGVGAQALGSCGHAKVHGLDF